MRAHLLMLTFAVAALGAAAVGCVPQTEYRRGALVTAPAGEQLTEPVTGVAQGSLTVTYTDGATKLAPVTHDPSMHRAEWQLGGYLRFAAGDYVAAGLHGLYSHVDWSQESALGTPPVDPERVWGMGGNLSVMGPLDGAQRVRLGGTMAFTFVSMPWSSWQRTTTPTNPWEDLEFDPADHVLVDSGTDVLFLTRLSLYVHVRAEEHVAIVAGVSVQNQATNIGFDDMPRDGSTLRPDDWGAVPFLGLTVYAMPELFVQLSYYYPAGYEQMSNLVDKTWGGFGLSFGGNFGERPQAPAAAPPPPPGAVYGPTGYPPPPPPTTPEVIVLPTY